MQFDQYSRCLVTPLWLPYHCPDLVWPECSPVELIFNLKLVFRCTPRSSKSALMVIRPWFGRACQISCNLSRFIRQTIEDLTALR